MLGTRALRTCAVCRDKLRLAQVSGPSRSRGLATTPKPSFLAESRRTPIDIDDSVFGASPIRGTSRSESEVNTDVEHAYLEDEEWAPREERRSPAAVFGSKRVGLETIPRRLEENIQSEINSVSSSSFVVQSWTDCRPPSPRNPRSVPDDSQPLTQDQITQTRSVRR